MNLPALAALNQDGTINTQDNPAPLGSIVTVFGSGLGALSPTLKTGELSPIPPAGALSQSTLYRICWGCSDILYLGSAPGQSTSVVQVNVRIPQNTAATGIRPFGIGIGVGGALKGIFISSASGVVFVK
jgi:uncharacterized protein (TIGR03437 family)